MPRRGGKAPFPWVGVGLLLGILSLTLIREVWAPEDLRRGLVLEQPREARQLVATLGDLLSESLEATEPTHALASEIAWLQRYGAIRATRHNQVKVRAGEYFDTKGSDPMVIVGATRVLRARMDVNEREVARLHVGQRMYAQVTAFGSGC